MAEFSARQHIGATAFDASRSYVDRITPYPDNIEAELHHSMVRLPEKPMMPRLFDERVGYFTTRHQDFSDDDYRSRTVQYIARWRLEKKDPTAAVSDPVKPIVYYLHAATPKKWAPYPIKGIEDWNEAFLDRNGNEEFAARGENADAGYRVERRRNV